MNTHTQQSLEDLYRVDPVKACQKALAITGKGGFLPEEDRMQTINGLLGLHGVEALRGNWQNGYWCDIVATYCNTGDTYGITVICERGETRFDNARYYVGSWGDLVERKGERLGVQ